MKSLSNYLFSCIAALCLLSASLTQPAQSGVNPVEIGEFLQNDFNYVVVHDSFFIAAMQGGLGVLQLERSEVSGPRSFALARFLSTERLFKKLRSTDDILVAQSADGSFSFYDLSALPQIGELGVVNYANEIQDFLFDGEFLYFAEEFNGVTQYRVENFKTLQFADSSMKPISSVQLEMISDTLYVLDDYNGILRYANPAAGLKQILNYLYLPVRAISITLGDSKAILSEGVEGFEVVEFDSDGFTSEFIQRQTVTYAGRVLETDSNYVIISSPNTIELQDKLDAGDARFISVSGNTMSSLIYDDSGRQILVTPSNEKGLTAYHLNVSGYPVEEAQYDHAGPVSALELIGDYLYTAGPNSKLEKYDSRSGFPPTLVGSREFPPSVSAMTSRGDTLFAVDARAQRMWVIHTSGDSLPRAIATIAGLPASIDEIKLYLDIESGRKVFIMKSGGTFYFNRAEDGELFNARSVRLELGIGALTVAYANQHLYHYSSESGLVVSSVSFFYTVTEISRLVMNPTVNAIIPLPGDQELLLLSPGLAQIASISDPHNPKITSAIALQGDYHRAVVKNNLIFAVGPASTGILEIVSGRVRELSHLSTGAKLISPGAYTFYTSAGNSIKMYEFLTTSVDDESDEPFLPADFRLTSSFPNPFNGTTTIRFSGLAKRNESAIIVVFNALGRKVREIALSQADRSAGAVQWDARNQRGIGVATGIYFARLQSGQTVSSLKMIYLK